MEPVFMPLNHAVVTIAAKLFPTGYDVSEDAPDTLDKLRDHVARTGRMVVDSGNSDHTIFADPEVNWAFRAWHDHCHLRGDYGFNLHDECSVAREQISDIRKLYGHGPIADRMCALIWAEVVGQAQYEKRNGYFPENQRSFDLDYLRDQDAALDRDYSLTRMAA